MPERRRFRRINVDLDGFVQLQRTNDTRECVIRNINEECMGVMIATSDPNICAREDLNLAIIIPADRSPAKCTGRITWYSKDEDYFKGNIGYLAGVFITDISRIDRRRLELLIAQKRSVGGRSINRQWN